MEFTHITKEIFNRPEYNVTNKDNIIGEIPTICNNKKLKLQSINDVTKSLHLDLKDDKVIVLSIAREFLYKAVRKINGNRNINILLSNLQNVILFHGNIDRTLVDATDLIQLKIEHC